jgi:hypothetical protein
MSIKVTVQARYRNGRWELSHRSPEDPWGMREVAYFDDLETLAIHGPSHLLGEEDLNAERIPEISATIEFTDRMCPIGQRGKQVLRDVIQEPGGWQDRLVEYLVTIGCEASGHYTALHQVNYGIDGHVRFTSIQLPTTVGAWAADHLEQLARVAAIAADKELHRRVADQRRAAETTPPSSQA